MGDTGALIALDYKKAYDTISKKFMIKSFKKFGFGKYFTKWIKIITSNSKSSIHYAGWLSGWFDLERGIRQGCPLSPLLFIIAIELLSCKIRQNSNIKGIKLPKQMFDREIKISQYADDSTLTLGDEKSIHESIKLITEFSGISGLKLNRNKTEAIWLGCWKFRKKEILDINWNTKPNGTLKILGIHISNDRQIHEIAENWESKFIKCENIIKSWRNRKLTIAGRITLVKSFLMAQFIYLMQATILPDEVLKRINTLFFKYIWSKGDIFKENEIKKIPESIKRDVMIQNYKDKGLNMINMMHLQISLSYKWITRLLCKSNAKWTDIPRWYYAHLNSDLNIFKVNVRYEDIRGIHPKFPYFYKKLLEMWTHQLDNNDNSKSGILWNNNQFRYRGNVLHIKRWIHKGICHINDLTNQNGIISYNKVAEILGYSPMTQFEFNVVYNATKDHIPGILGYTNSIEIEWHGKKLSTLSSKQIRNELVNQVKIKSVHIWNNTYRNLAWELIPNITKEQRLITLQWKILHGIYPTNIYLKKIKISDTETCRYCDQRDTIEHFFFECKVLKSLWSKVEDEIAIANEKRIALNTNLVLTGILDKSIFANKQICKHVNTIIMIGKSTISRFKYGKHPNLNILYEEEKLIRSVP